MQDKTKALAITLQVDGKDLECLIGSVFNSLTQDGMAEYYLSAPKSEQVEIIQAYVSHARKKFENFATAYMANDKKRNAFNLNLFSVYLSRHETINRGRL